DEYEETPAGDGTIRRTLVRKGHRFQVRTSGPYDREWAKRAAGELVTIVHGSEGEAAEEIEMAARRALAKIRDVLLNCQGQPPPTRQQSDWLIQTAAILLAGAADDLQGAIGDDAPDAGRGDGGEEG